VTSYLVTISGEHQIGGAGKAYTIADDGGAGKVVFASAPPADTVVEVLAIQVGAAPIGVDLMPGLFESVLNNGITSIPSPLNYDVSTQQIMYFPTAAANNYILNIRGSSGTPLSSYLANGKSLTLVLMVTQGGTSYNLTTIKIDGVDVAGSTKWSGGIVPAAEPDTVQVYSLTIVRTNSNNSSPTYAVFGSGSKFSAA
jgi:hypothetical protein